MARGTTLPWVLTGGAALGGFYTLHRTTRDLDLTPRDRRGLGLLPVEVERCLAAAGLDVRAETLERDHVRIHVRDPSESVLLELIGNWSPASEEPRSLNVEGATIAVDSPHELLVRKLMALFDRSEPRDLQDVGALLDNGGDLDRALADAATQFTGFSRHGLAQVIRALPIERLATVVRWTPEQTAAALTLRGELLRRLETDLAAES